MQTNVHPSSSRRRVVRAAVTGLVSLVSLTGAACASLMGVDEPTLINDGETDANGVAVLDGTATNNPNSETGGCTGANCGNTDAATSSDGNAPDAPGIEAGVDAGPAVFALSFDGVDDLIRLNRTVQDDFTLEAWIATTFSRTGTNFWEGLGLIYADVFGTANDFGTSILNGKFAFGTVNTTVQSTTTVTTGQWVHVAAVRVKSSGAIRVLINGVQETTGTSSTATLNASSTIDIGANAIDSRYFGGRIDEVRIWNTARSAAQIQATMSTKLVGTEAGLVGYWRFDEGSGAVANDSSPTNNDGNLGNGGANARPTYVLSGAF